MQKDKKWNALIGGVFCILIAQNWAIADNVWTGTSTSVATTRTGTTTVKNTDTYYKYVRLTPDIISVDHSTPGDHSFTTIERGKVSVRGTSGISNILEPNKITLTSPSSSTVINLGTITLTEPGTTATTITGSGMRINTTSNVVNGVTYPLAVKGKICAQELVVSSTGWADYVLKKDYKLPGLNEVEKHISEKGTLPGIPSAKEVELKGVSVGEMQEKLLAKVEELTLYVIKQQKEIEQLKSTLNTTTSRDNK